MTQTRQAGLAQALDIALDGICRGFEAEGLPVAQICAALEVRLHALGWLPSPAAPHRPTRPADTVLREGERYHVAQDRDGRDVYAPVDGSAP